MLIVTILWGPSAAHVTLDSPEMEQHVLVNMITLLSMKVGFVLFLKVMHVVLKKKCHLLPIQSKSSTDGEKGRLWDTWTRRSHSAQIPSPRVVRKSCLIHRFLSPLLHEQIQIHQRQSILEKTCSCNRIKLNYQATKKKIESTRKHRRLGSKFCDRLHHIYLTCSKNKENTLT